MSRLSLSRKRAASSDTSAVAEGGRADADHELGAVKVVDAPIAILSDSRTDLPNVFGAAHKRRHAQLLQEALADAEPDMMAPPVAKSANKQAAPAAHGRLAVTAQSVSHRIGDAHDGIAAQARQQGVAESRCNSAIDLTLDSDDDDGTPRAHIASKCSTTAFSALFKQPGNRTVVPALPALSSFSSSSTSSSSVLAACRFAGNRQGTEYCPVAAQCHACTLARPCPKPAHSIAHLCPRHVARSRPCADSCLVFGTHIVGRKFVKSMNDDDDSADGAAVPMAAVGTTTWQLVCFRRDLHNARDAHAIHVCALELPVSSGAWRVAAPLGYLPARVARAVGTSCSRSNSPAPQVCECGDASIAQDADILLCAIGYIPADQKVRADQPLPLIVHLHADVNVGSSACGAALVQAARGDIQGAELLRGMVISLSTPSSLCTSDEENIAPPFGHSHTALASLLAATAARPFDLNARTVALCDDTYRLFALAYYAHCFDSAQINLLRAFGALSDDARRLLVRLGARRGPFWRRAELEAKHASAAVDELLQHTMLCTADALLVDRARSETVSISSTVADQDELSWSLTCTSVFAAALSSLHLPAIKQFAVKIAGGGARIASLDRSGVLAFIHQQLNGSQRALDGRRLVHLPSTRAALRACVSATATAAAAASNAGDLVCLSPTWYIATKRAWQLRGGDCTSALAASELGHVQYVSYAPGAVSIPFFGSACALRAYTRAQQTLRAALSAVEADDLDATLPLLHSALVELRLESSARSVRALIGDVDSVKVELPRGDNVRQGGGVSAPIVIDVDDNDVDDDDDDDDDDGATQIITSTVGLSASAAPSREQLAFAHVLARHTATWTHAECAYQALKVLEKHKMFALAVEIAEAVLGVDTEACCVDEASQPAAVANTTALLARLLELDEPEVLAAFGVPRGVAAEAEVEAETLCSCPGGCDSPLQLSTSASSSSSSTASSSSSSSQRSIACHRPSRAAVLALHSRRGALWVRLVLNLTAHLKQPQRAATACRLALADEQVRAGDLCELSARAAKLGANRRAKAAKDAHAEASADADAAALLPDLSACVPETVLIGRATSKRAGVKSRFFLRDDSIGTVEELVLEHFARDGWRGIHCENGLFLTLSSLLCCDLLFDDRIPDAFHAPFCSAPLDWRTGAFYVRRRAAIDARLARIAQGDAPALLQVAFSERFAGCAVAGVGDWDVLALAELQLVCTALGGAPLACIVRRLLIDGEAWCGGLPDLLLLREHEAMLVEVKSERDRLSHQQRAWLAVLHARGAHVRVCRVREDAARVAAESDDE